MTDGRVLYDDGVAREAADAGALLDRYEALLAEALEDADDDALAGAGVSAATIESIESGDGSEVAVEDAAAVVAAATGEDPDALLAEVRESLLLGMSTAMLDVDRIAADVEDDVDPKEVQGKVEGRHPMTLGEYARIHHYVANAG